MLPHATGGYVMIPRDVCVQTLRQWKDKDVAQRLKIDTATVRGLVALLDDIGNLSSPASIAKAMSTAGTSISAPTVGRYFDAREETLQRELSSFNGAKDNYPKTLITLDDAREQSYDGIRCVYALDWLREA